MNKLLECTNHDKAGEIRAALDAGNYRQAYRLFRPRWAEGLDSIPINLHGGLVRHVLAGQPVGHFLTALLTNDLMEVLARGDPGSLANLRQLCIFLHTATPPLCHGSHAKVTTWREEGGALGLYYDAAAMRAESDRAECEGPLNEYLAAKGEAAP